MRTIALTLALVWSVLLDKLFPQVPPFSKIKVTILTYKMETHLYSRRLSQRQVGSESALRFLVQKPHMSTILVGSFVCGSYVPQDRNYMSDSLWLPHQKECHLKKQNPRKEPPALLVDCTV